MRPKLPDELPLRPAVAFAKGVNCIDLAEIKRRPFDKRRSIQPNQQLLLCQPVEEFFQSARDVHRRPEVSVPLRDVGDAKLARPGEDILKEIAMNGLQMGAVELAGNAAITQLADSARDERSLDKLQLCIICNVEAITRAVIATFRVRIVHESRSHRGSSRVCCWGTRRPPSRQHSLHMKTDRC